MRMLKASYHIKCHLLVCGCFPARREFPDWNQLTEGLAMKKESSHEHRPATLRQLWLAMVLPDVSKKLYHHSPSRIWR